MSEVSDFIFNINKEYIKKAIEKKCNEYDESFNIKKIYKDNIITGIFVWKETDDSIYLEEAHYSGNNKFLFLKIWKESFKKNKTCFTCTNIFNKKMTNFLNKMGFKIYNEIGSVIFLKREATI